MMQQKSQRVMVLAGLGQALRDCPDVEAQEDRIKSVTGRNSRTRDDQYEPIVAERHHARVQ